MKYLVTLVCLIVACQALNFNKTEWNNFKLSFGKVYKNLAEEEYRLRIFLEKKFHIEEHNKKYEQGLTTFKKGINKFSDLTKEEVIQNYTGYKGVFNISNPIYFRAIENLTVADSVDWRTKGAVTAVKDQGNCGSCWAFSATGATEGQHFLKFGLLVSLSEQNLVDCTPNDYGCGGGLPMDAFDYISSNGGIDTEESYPYEANDGSCRFKASSVGAKVTNYTYLPVGDEQALQQAIATVGPISIAIDAGGDFMDYESGILDDKSCSSEYLDHAILAVGYGSENGVEYYIVKNSWGSSWGEDGYVRMSRNKNNQCGVASQATYPTVSG